MLLLNQTFQLPGSRIDLDDYNVQDEVDTGIDDHCGDILEDDAWHKLDVRILECILDDSLHSYGVVVEK